MSLPKMADDYFTPKELACPCCGFLNFKESFLKKLNMARLVAGISFPINSACRCPKHNAQVGGSPTSSHLATPDKECTAIDIGCNNSADRFKILFALENSGINRFEFAPPYNWIHCDDDKTKVQNIIEIKK